MCRGELEPLAGTLKSTPFFRYRNRDILEDLVDATAFNFVFFRGNLFSISEEMRAMVAGMEGNA